MASLLRRSAPRLIGSICPSRPQGPPRRFSSTCSATKPTSVPGLWVSFGLLGAVGALGLGFGASAGAKQAERQRAVPAPDISPPEVDSSTSPQQSAFNPETGEINWDCPCLGGMAHGVCGEQFKIAFGCFVYSEAEPKGVECIEAFKSMQECFKAHPDVYGEELVGQEDEQQDHQPPSGDEPEELAESERHLFPPSGDQSSEEAPLMETSISDSERPSATTALSTKKQATPPSTT